MKGLRTILTVAIGAVLGGYLLFFALNNTAPVDIDLVFTRTPAPVWALVVVSFLAGAALVGLSTALFAFRHGRERRRSTRRIAALQKEVHELRNAPLRGVLGEDDVLGQPGPAAEPAGHTETRTEALGPGTE